MQSVVPQISEILRGQFVLIVCNRNGMYRAGPKKPNQKEKTVAASENSSHKDSSTLHKASGYSFPSFF